MIDVGASNSWFFLPAKDDVANVPWLDHPLTSVDRYIYFSTLWCDSCSARKSKFRPASYTGMATVGGYGSSERKEYTAMGMQTNIAAKIEESCEPGGILISHTTWALVKDEVSCSEKKNIKVKGLHRPIRVYSVVNENL